IVAGLTGLNLHWSRTGYERNLPASQLSVSRQKPEANRQLGRGRCLDGDSIPGEYFGRQRVDRNYLTCLGDVKSDDHIGGGLKLVISMLSDLDLDLTRPQERYAIISEYGRTGQHSNYDRQTGCRLNIECERVTGAWMLRPMVANDCLV